MKKRYGLFLLLSLCMGTLLSCGNSDNNDNKDDPVTPDDPDPDTPDDGDDDPVADEDKGTPYPIEYLSYDDEDTPTFNWDKGETLSFNEISAHEVGESTNSETYDYDSIKVKMPTNTLGSDFMYSFDVSSLYSVEKNGGKYYGIDGKETEFFTLLKDAGVTHVRLRLWNDPYDLRSHSYGGGDNDLSTTLYLAKRASEVGLKIFLDFHYSDSWSDPSKYWVPKSWSNVLRRNRYQAVGDYTGKVLNTFKQEGIDVSAIQIGNETNNGMAEMSGTSMYIAYAIKAGVETAKSIFPDIKTYVHLTNVTNYDSVKKFLNNLVYYECDVFDVVGLSYYPYWHGSKENLLTVMNDIVETYGKEVAVVETSWGYTDEATTYASNQYSTDTCSEAGGYKTSIQAQASEIADIVDLLSQVNDSKGVGISYWEPAWLPVNGAGWISKYGAYYNDNGVDWETSASLSSYTDQYCKSSWANQALFSYNGRALPSLYTYKYLQNGEKDVKDEDVVVEGIVSSEFSGIYDKKLESYNIPDTGLVYDNLDRYHEEEITWDEDEYNALPSKDAGVYTINGVCGGYNVTCKVTVIYNYVDDYSFENQNTLQGNNANEYSVGDPWNLTASVNGVRVETKSEGNRTGTHYFHWWSSSSFTFDLSQTLKGVAKGTYSLQTYVLTHLTTEYGGYNKVGLYYQVGDGEKVEVSMLSNCAGYAAGMTLWEIPNIEVEEDNSTVVIGMYGDCGATTWGHNDDWSFALA